MRVACDACKAINSKFVFKYFFACLPFHATFMVNVPKFLKKFSFFPKTNVGYQGWNLQNAHQNRNREDPNQTASPVIWVCPVFLGLFGRR